MSPDFSRAAVLGRLLARLATQEVPAAASGPGDPTTTRPLAALTTRDNDDPAIALLDAWAGVIDVLSFYSDRIAEEGYLTTATEERSVLELAQMVGYEPRPGLAAGASLAFTVLRQPGLPETVAVPLGVRVQSIPGQDQQPQVFETVEPLLARPEWNAMACAAGPAATLRAVATQLELAGPPTVSAGAAVLLLDAAADRRFVAQVSTVATPTDGTGPAVAALQAPLNQTSAGAGAVGDDLVTIEAPTALTLPVRARLYGRDAPPMPAGGGRHAGGLYRYERGTGTWQRLQEGLPSGTVRAVATPRLAGARLVLVALDTGPLQRSADGGVTWRPLATPAAGADVHSLCADAAGTVFAGTGDGAVFRTRDGGDSWQQVGGGALVERRIFLRQKAGTSGQQPGDYEAAPLGEQRGTVGGGLPRATVHALTAGSGLLFAGTDDGVFRSLDGGASWQPCMGVTGVRSLALTTTEVVAATTTPNLLYHASLGLGGGLDGVFMDGWSVLTDLVPRAVAPASAGRSTDASGVVLATDEALFPDGPQGLAVGLPTPGVLAMSEDDTGIVVALAPGPGLDEDWPWLAFVDGQDWVDLDREIAEAAAGRWLVLADGRRRGAWPVRAVSVTTRQEAGPPTTVSRIHLGLGPDPRPWLGHAVRSTQVLLSGTPVALAPMPLTGSRITFDRPVAPLPAGRRILVCDSDTGGEEGTVSAMADERTVILTAPLHGSFARGAVTVFGNVALATHGETTENEVLGSGDVTGAHQRFALARHPLTYVAAATDTGDRAALGVSVGGVAWREASNLLDNGPQDQVFLARQGGNGQAEVVFGDGKHGARPASGTDNVTATYRHGLGAAGNVPARSLVTLQTRPLGVQEVTNPLPATGGGDAEPATAARLRLRHRVLTLGRLVTPADFEHFAAAFAGIADAQAVVLSAGGAALLHLTVAGVGGQDVPPGSAVHSGLVAAIERRRSLGRPVTVDSYRPVRFTVAARLLLAPATDPSAVPRTAVQAIAAAFSVGRGRFGVPVRRGQVLALLAALPAVVAVDLDQLCLAGEPPSVQPALACSRARWSAAGPLPAELLVPGSVTVTTATAG